VKVERFEDLYAWQKARLLTLMIYRVTGDGNFARDTSLGRQIQRAAVSIMSNIAEGFERGNRAEFYQFLNIAKSSCAELRSQLYVALDVGHLGKEKFDELMELAEEVARILGGLKLAVEKQRDEQRQNGKTRKA
jgi:four helix bundle protein